jgi:hypothetical protein
MRDGVALPARTSNFTKAGVGKIMLFLFFNCSTSAEILASTCVLESLFLGSIVRLHRDA